MNINNENCIDCRNQLCWWHARQRKSKATAKPGKQQGMTRSELDYNLLASVLSSNPKQFAR